MSWYHSRAVPARKMLPSNTVAASQREQRRILFFRSAANREIYGQAAGKQADRAEDRDLEHIARAGSADALSQIENVSDDKDDEDRRLRDNQAQDAHDAARRQYPCLVARA